MLQYVIICIESLASLFPLVNGIFRKEHLAKSSAELPWESVLRQDVSVSSHHIWTRAQLIGVTKVEECRCTCTSVTRQ